MFSLATKFRDKINERVTRECKFSLPKCVDKSFISSIYSLNVVQGALDIAHSFLRSKTSNAISVCIIWKTFE